MGLHMTSKQFVEMITKNKKVGSAEHLTVDLEELSKPEPAPEPELAKSAETQEAPRRGRPAKNKTEPAEPAEGAPATEAPAKHHLLARPFIWIGNIVSAWYMRVVYPHQKWLFIGAALGGLAMAAVMTVVCMLVAIAL